MKLLLYISAITGIILLVAGFAGYFAMSQYYQFCLFTGIFLILFICLPLFFWDRYRYQKKINRIIKSYENGEKQEERVQQKEKKPAKTGWSMNNSPFRERKSGLTWGGGNVKGATASRGNRKSFLK